jgi:hypothetical protein
MEQTEVEEIIEKARLNNLAALTFKNLDALPESICNLSNLVTRYGNETIEPEPMVLLKMTCPSTNHIHILRVPPGMTSAEAAITWVNHGIHPVGEASQNENRFGVQT